MKGSLYKHAVIVDSVSKDPEPLLSETIPARHNIQLLLWHVILEMARLSNYICLYYRGKPDVHAANFFELKNETQVWRS